MLEHLVHEVLEGGLGHPAGGLLQLGHVTQERVHLRGPEVLWRDLDEHLTRLLVDALLLHARPPPDYRPADHLKAEGDELTHAVLLVGGDHKILRVLQLQHHPHGLDVVPGVAPVPQGVQVPEKYPVPAARHDRRHVGCDLLCHKGAPSSRRLVVEEDAVQRVHVVRLAVVLHYPEAVELGHRVRRPWIERCGLLLRNLLHQAVKLRRGCLVEPRRLLQTYRPDRLQDAQRAHAIGLRGVLRFLEGDLDVRLRGQVVDLIRLDLGHDGHQVRAVDHVSVVQVHLVEDVVDPCGVEGRGPPDDAVDLILLIEKELCEVGSILAGDARDECCLAHLWKGGGGHRSA
mmetsp:Transcript_8622/g.19669  ORF Transcript_8622/g.19669 Transcript_8622/m.19669 type:complete len:344 (-) Transcript_8622:53-1084(-)